MTISTQRHIEQDSDIDLLSPWQQTGGWSQVFSVQTPSPHEDHPTDNPGTPQHPPADPVRVCGCDVCEEWWVEGVCVCEVWVVWWAIWAHGMSGAYLQKRYMWEWGCEGVSSVISGGRTESWNVHSCYKTQAITQPRLSPWLQVIWYCCRIYTPKTDAQGHVFSGQHHTFQTTW